jgi:hypothetical protein
MQLPGYFQIVMLENKYRKSVINMANETVENMLTLLEAMPESAPSASTRIRLYDHDGLVELEVHIEVLRKTTITE